MSTLLPYFEIIWMIVVIIILAVRKNGQAAGFMGCWFVIWLLCFADPAAMSQIPMQHEASVAHILISWCAKISILGVASASILRPHGKRVIGVCWALICQCLSVLLGMIWALDDSSWGSLWQWDAIESLSLCMVFMLYGWLRSPGGTQCWAWGSILLIGLQNALVYGLFHFGNSSIHRYADNEHALFVGLGMLGWLVCLAIWHLRHLRHSGNANIPQRDTREFVCFAVVVLGIAACGLRIPGWALCAVFVVVWALLSAGRTKRSIALCIAGAVILISVTALPTRYHTQWAQLEGSGNTETVWKLAGIQTESAGECLRYSAILERDGQFEEVKFDACSNEIRPVDAVEVWGDGRMEQLRVIEYDASRGVGILVRDVTLDRMLELCLIILFFVLLLGIKRKVYEDLADSEDEQRQCLYV
ncbi:MAG: hypothetical protein IJM59_14030 [Proteobacteria bacterium]|nr:hypothetical protein [Pseudomonadota bacterium]